MRSRVVLTPDPGVARDAARVEMRLGDGTTVVEDVQHARGNLAVPLSNDRLDQKVHGLVERSVPGREKQIVEAARTVAEAPSARRWFADLAAGERA